MKSKTCDHIDANRRLGKEIITLLDLKIVDGRVSTSWGTKTELGLGASVRRILEDCDILERGSTDEI